MKVSAAFLCKLLYLKIIWKGKRSKRDEIQRRPSKEVGFPQMISKFIGKSQQPGHCGVWKNE